MKRLTFIIGLLFLVTNILFGFIITAYPTFNVYVNSGIILITTALVSVLEKLNMKDAFRISLSAIFITCGAIQFILGLISPPSFADNWYLIAVTIILVFEIALLTTSKYVSQIVK